MQDSLTVPVFQVLVCFQEILMHSGVAWLLGLKLGLKPYGLVVLEALQSHANLSCRWQVVVRDSSCSPRVWTQWDLHIGVQILLLIW